MLIRTTSSGNHSGNTLFSHGVDEAVLMRVTQELRRTRQSGRRRSWLRRQGRILSHNVLQLYLAPVPMVAIPAEFSWLHMCVHLRLRRSDEYPLLRQAHDWASLTAGGAGRCSSTTPTT